MFNSKTTTNDYIFLIVTHECTKRCPFCIDSERGKKEYITLANVKKAIDYCIDNNVGTITVLGGEPTCHSDIIDICRLIKSYGLNIVMTTNYMNPVVVKALDGIVDSFNISHYDQDVLPKQEDFKSDLTLSKLLIKDDIDTKEKLDAFIDTYQNDFNDIKFSTLTDINEFTRTHKDLPFLNDLLIDRKVTIMGEIEGHYYRGYLIKRFDIKATDNYYCQRSMKMHVNGILKRTWV